MKLLLIDSYCKLNTRIGSHEPDTTALLGSYSLGLRGIVMQIKDFRLVRMDSHSLSAFNDLTVGGSSLGQVMVIKGVYPETDDGFR